MAKTIDPNLARAKATAYRKRALSFELPTIVVLAFLMGLFIARSANEGWIPVIVLGMPVGAAILYWFYFRWSNKREMAEHWEIESQLDEQRRAETQARIDAAKASGALNKFQKK